MLTGLRRRRAATLCLPLGLLAVGAAAAAGAGAAPAAVVIERYAYGPAQLTVNAGDSVTWTNNDRVGHDVTSVGGGPLKSSLLGKGQSYSITFTGAGTFRYTCTIHPDMLATVTVRAPATTTTSTAVIKTTSTVAGAAKAATTVPSTTVPFTTVAPPPAATNIAAGIGPGGVTEAALSSDAGRARINPLLFIVAVVVAVAVGATIALFDPAHRRSDDR